MKNLITVGLALCVCACSSASVTPTTTEPVRADVTATMPDGTPGLGEATAVAVLPGVPSGVRVAYVFDNRLWLWAGGIGVPLTTLGSDGAFALSADGSWLAFSRDDGLWVVDASGTNESVLVGSESFMTLPPVDPGVRLNVFGWRPGAAQLLFNTSSRVDGNQPTNDLYRVDLETFGRDNPAPAGSGGAFWPAPDGRTLALTRADGVSLLDFESGQVRETLTFEPVQIGADVAWVPQPVWLPDSSAVLVAIASGQTEVGTVVWRIPLTGEAEQVGQVPAPFGATLSPDGVAVAYPRPDDGVWVRTLADQADVRWAPDGFSFAQWLPDARRLLVDRDADGLSFVAAPGAEPEPVSNEFISAIRWLADDAFVYTTLGSGGETLRMATLGGTEIVIAGPSPVVLPFQIIIP